MAMLTVVLRNFAKAPKNILSETFLIQRGTEREIINNLHWPPCNAKIFFCIPEFYQQILEKHSCIKFNENPSIGSRAVSYGRTNMMKLIVAFRNFVNASKTFFQTKPVEKINPHILCSTTFLFENRAVYVIMWKIVQSWIGHRHITRCMRIVCRINEAKDKTLEYVIITALPQQQWLHQLLSMLRYTHNAPLLFNHKLE